MSYVTGFVECNCGRRVVIRTSWTNENPGRRFQACRDYKRGGCRFFAWEDPPMCQRATLIIPGLLKKINALELENKKLKSENKKMLMVVVVMPVILLLIMWICKYGGSKDAEVRSLKMIP